MAEQFRMRCEPSKSMVDQRLYNINHLEALALEEPLAIFRP